MIAQKKLKAVNRPSRYLGGEMGSCVKSKQNNKIALLVPTIYEEAMSNNKVVEIYNQINSMQGFSMERIFAVMPDYENILRRENISLTTIETETSLKDMQVILVVIDDVMQITNVLNTLNLAKVPILNTRRDDTFPIVIFSGKAMLNPKPFLKFADCIVCGEIENLLQEVLNICVNKNEAKESKISELEKFKFVYTNLNHEKDLEWYIKEDFEYIPTKKNIIPSIDKGIEVNLTKIFKGSELDFAQEKYVYGKNIEKINPIFEMKDKILKTGEKEILIDTKNVLDFETIRDIIYEISADNFFKDSKVKLLKANITKKNLWVLNYTGSKANILLEEKYSKQEILELSKEIFERDCSDINLKYVIGKSKENYEDLIALLDLAENIVKMYFNIYPNSSKTKILTIELIPFVPLIFTPLEWSEVNSPEKLEIKTRYIMDKNTNEYINIIPFNTYVPCIETMLLRGDMDVSNIIYDAWKNGAKLDNFQELFRKEPWEIALNKNKKTLKSFLERIDVEDTLPWDNMKIKTNKEELLKIYESEIKHRDENNSDK